METALLDYLYWIISYSNLREPSPITTSYTFGLLPNLALNASFVFSTKLSYNSSLKRVIVQPQDPPPITREPVTPYSLAQSFRKSSSSQLTSYSLLMP